MASDAQMHVQGYTWSQLGSTSVFVALYTVVTKIRTRKNHSLDEMSDLLNVILLCLTGLQARLDMYWKCTDKTAKGEEIVMVQQHNTARVTRRY